MEFEPKSPPGGKAQMGRKPTSLSNTRKVPRQMALQGPLQCHALTKLLLMLGMRTG